MPRPFHIWILAFIPKMHLFQKMKVLKSILDKLMALKYNFLLFYLVDMVSYAENVIKLLAMNSSSSGSPAAIKSLFKLTFKGRRFQNNKRDAVICKGYIAFTLSGNQSPNLCIYFFYTKFLFQELTPNILFSLVMYRIRFDFRTKHLQKFERKMV